MDPSDKTIPQIDIGRIVIGNRIRKNVGDINGLAENIKEIGLLHPIVIDENNQLIAGQRRLSACQQLGWKTVPVRVLDLDALLHQKAEASENLYRQDLTPAEKELAASALLARIERPAAAERQREGGTTQGPRGKEGGRERRKPLGQNLAKGISTRDPHVRRADDRAGKAVGLSRTSLHKIKEIREAAEEEPEHFQPFYDALQEKGAKVEKVYSSYRKELSKLSVPPEPPEEYGEGRIRLLNKDFLDPEVLATETFNIIVTSPHAYGSESISRRIPVQARGPVAGRHSGRWGGIRTGRTGRRGRRALR